MNSGLFTNSLFGAQNSLANEAFTSDAPFSSYSSPLGSFFGSSFQQDGSQMQTPFANFGMQTGGVPQGLFAAIAAAIAQFFQQGQSMPDAVPFDKVDLSSIGDPHDAVTGMTQNGKAVNAHWDDMDSHRNLLSAPSAAGGLRISSQVGKANAKGATMNERIEVNANRGRTKISYDANGVATVRQGNVTNTMVANETLDLGNGLSLTDTGTSLVVHAKDQQGGELVTTLAKNGQGGIDVNASGKNISLGGYLVNSSSQRAQTAQA